MHQNAAERQSGVTGDDDTGYAARCRGHVIRRRWRCLGNCPGTAAAIAATPCQHQRAGCREDPKLVLPTDFHADYSWLIFNKNNQKYCVDEAFSDGSVGALPQWPISRNSRDETSGQTNKGDAPI
ncbi:hypothetical protein [Actimicrobium antarcticum]|uniref:hypothetical protein n=1 Tax=Actimicrobium antarcticum TaxID=1051899 RepID=UPI0031DFA049